MIEKNNNCQICEYNWISNTFSQRYTTPKHDKSSMINPIQLHDYIWHKL